MLALSRLDVTPAKERQFGAKGITSVEELIMFFPRKYYDFREKRFISSLRDGDLCRVSGTILKRYLGKRADVILSDGTGELRVTWFNGCYFYSRMQAGTEWTFCGKISEYEGTKQMVQPILFAEGLDMLAGIHPVYSKIQGMAEKYLREKMEAGLSLLTLNSPWSERDALAKTLGMGDRGSAIRQIHQPTSSQEWKLARRRVAFDEIYSFYEELYQRRRTRSLSYGRPMPEEGKTRTFINSLPFPLTADQSKAVEEVMAGVKGMSSLNKLITGDVGCGKTAVALISAVLAWENRFQTIIMAPTLVLAKQHYEEMSSLARSVGIRFALLTGETKSKERKAILAGLKDGSIHVLIGTHSVLSPSLEFQSLGMTIVDEEHRFGAQQKAQLESFDKSGAHHLSMTATPIPRSYASAIYGGCVDIICIETMPTGRKPIITSLVKDRGEAYQALLAEVHQGHQGYVICPFIEDSSSDRFQDVLSVHTIFEELKGFCAAAAPSVTVACISGDMRQKDVQATIDRFASGEVALLVSTTIVEVGVNVPNATSIAVMNAERFGLSALHQLRGRVGRGGDQGYCFLVSSEENEKLTAMTMYSSGFQIAEMDMRLRGPGDVLGDEQTGESKIIDLILRRPNLAANIRHFFDEKRN